MLVLVPVLVLMLVLVLALALVPLAPTVSPRQAASVRSDRSYGSNHTVTPASAAARNSAAAATANSSSACSPLP